MADYTTKYQAAIDLTADLGASPSG